MHFHHPTARLGGPLLFLVLLSSAFTPLAAPPQDPTAPFPRKGAYAGEARCVECHERQANRLRRAPHAAILAAAALPACETCHGPGKAHADDPDNDIRLITLPPSLSIQNQIAFCGRCHADQIDHHGGDPAGFVQAGKACTDCHEVHREHQPGPLPGLRLRSRATAAVHAEPTGAGKCLECHPLRDELLARSAHRSLSSAHRSDGCELCHGNGSLHVQSGGLARLITRPDRAMDGATNCRTCHMEVDPVEFHWRGQHKPLLSEGATCTTCHEVHIRAGDDLHRFAAATAPTNRICASCHAPAMCVLPGTVHDSLSRLQVSLAQGCGACHEGALDHARSGGRTHVEPMRGSGPEVQARVCLSCHQDEQALAHVQQGTHQRSGVSCLSCHSQAVKRGKGEVRAQTESRCRQCHADVQAEFALPNHHPVPEGRMHCSSCHEVHGTRHRVRDLELTETACVQCHVQYRGPFVYAHQAGRREGCVVCHLPHGSANRRLLQQVNTQQNCLQCHGDFPSFHDQTSGALYTDCIRCHTEVHGSNHSRFLFR